MSAFGGRGAPCTYICTHIAFIHLFPCIAWGHWLFKWSKANHFPFSPPTCVETTEGRLSSCSTITKLKVSLLGSRKYLPGRPRMPPSPPTGSPRDLGPVEIPRGGAFSPGGLRMEAGGKHIGRVSTLNRRAMRTTVCASERCGNRMCFTKRKEPHLISCQGSWVSISKHTWKCSEQRPGSLLSCIVLPRWGAKSTPEKSRSVVPGSLSPKWNARAAPCPLHIKSQQATPRAAGLLFHTNEFLIVDVYDSFYIQFYGLFYDDKVARLYVPEFSIFPLFPQT